MQATGYSFSAKSADMRTASDEEGFLVGAIPNVEREEVFAEAVLGINHLETINHPIIGFLGALEGLLRLVWEIFAKTEVDFH
jgi:hypothetical protein